MKLDPVSIDIARNVMQGSDTLAAKLGGIVSGEWNAAKLWDPAILNMRVDAGELHTNLELLGLIGGDVLTQLSNDVVSALPERLAKLQSVLDEIQLDRGGEFKTDLTEFQQFSAKVSAELREVLAGYNVLGEAVTTSKPVTAATDAVAAADQLKTRTAGQ